VGELEEQEVGAVDRVEARYVFKEAEGLNPTSLFLAAGSC